MRLRRQVCTPVLLTVALAGVLWLPAPVDGDDRDPSSVELPRSRDRANGGASDILRLACPPFASFGRAPNRDLRYWNRPCSTVAT